MISIHFGRDGGFSGERYFDTVSCEKSGEGLCLPLCISLHTKTVTDHCEHKIQYIKYWKLDLSKQGDEFRVTGGRQSSIQKHLGGVVKALPFSKLISSRPLIPALVALVLGSLGPSQVLCLSGPKIHPSLALVGISSHSAVLFVAHQTDLF